MRLLLRKPEITKVSDRITGNGSLRSRQGFKTCNRSIVTSCRAVLLPRFGGPDVLQLRDNVNVPDLKPNVVLVRARAVSINPLDTRVSI